MIVTMVGREIREGARGDYLYIKYKTEKGKDGGKAVFSQLRDKWELCQENAVIDLKLDDKYNVVDVIKPELAVDEGVLKAPQVAKQAPKEPAPQAVGRCWNDVGEMIRTKTLSMVFGKTTAEKIALCYKVHMLDTLDIPYDKDEISKFGKAEP